MNQWDKCCIWIVVFMLIFTCLMQQWEIASLKKRERQKDKKLMEAFQEMRKNVMKVNSKVDKMQLESWGLPPEGPW